MNSVGSGMRSKANSVHTVRKSGLVSQVKNWDPTSGVVNVSIFVVSSRSGMVHEIQIASPYIELNMLLMAYLDLSRLKYPFCYKPTMIEIKILFNVNAFVLKMCAKNVQCDTKVLL